jgi:hypothetical protein
MTQKALTVDPERLDQLRAILGELDPGGRKAWILEFYDRRNGEDVLNAVINIKTGRPYRRTDETIMQQEK